MHYDLVVFGVKDTTVDMVEYIHQNLHPVALVVTIGQKALAKNHVSGFSPMHSLRERHGIHIFETEAYGLNDEACAAFFGKNTFGLGISMGWQRLIPGSVLGAFQSGVFGLHGSAAYLPYGRGRSPMNWSIILGDERFILNLFQYDEGADSPNVFANTMFEINAHDTIRTVQYKHLYSAKKMIAQLITAWKADAITIRRDSRDPDGWYQKRTPADGALDFAAAKTRQLYNLIRGVTRPFPGTYAFAGGRRVTVWRAQPFDAMLDFSAHAPGEVIDVFDGCPAVRTLDGSLLLTEYESDEPLAPGEVLTAAP